MNSEIFEEWWEYFLVIYWGFSHPKSEKLLGRKNVKKLDLEKKYESKFEEVLNSEDDDKVKNLSDFIESKYEDEKERKKIIENKAHSIIGQTSIAVTLLLAAISISTTQYGLLPMYFKIIIWVLFFIIILNFVTAGLHARNVVTALEGFANHSVEIFFLKEKYRLNILLEKYFMSEYNSYLNDVKATYLRFSHWYFKFSFILTVVIALLLPPSIMLVDRPEPEPLSKSGESINVNNNYYNSAPSKDTVIIK